jgi:hypothetical protein
MNSHTAGGLTREAFLFVGTRHARRAGRRTPSARGTSDADHPSREAQPALRLGSNPSPAAGLREIARDTASVIVVGSSHGPGLGGVLAGRVTESVLPGAPVPVDVAPHDCTGTDRRLLTVGCGFDGSSRILGGAHVGHRSCPSPTAAYRCARCIDTRVAFGGVSTGGMISHQSAKTRFARRSTANWVRRSARAATAPRPVAGYPTETLRASSPRRARRSICWCSARAAIGPSATCRSAASRARRPAPPPASSSCYLMRNSLRPGQTRSRYTPRPDTHPVMRRVARARNRRSPSAGVGSIDVLDSLHHA